MNLFTCYPRCTTCQKAQRWLDAHGVAYAFRDIKKEHPSETELREWVQRSGLPLKRFFNTSGQTYRELGLSSKMAAMSEDELFALLASDGMLVKRPVMITGHAVLVGFNEEVWAAALL